MSERALWQTMRKHLGPFGILQRVENAVGAGLPDVCYCMRWQRHLRNAPDARSGWVELKHVPAWPARAGTPLSIQHFTAAQAEWLKAWRMAGGNAWLLLQVGREYLLIDVLTAADIQTGALVREVIYRRAKVYRANQFPTMEILRWLAAPKT